MPIPVIAIFDIGKTNKKIFLLDEQYRIVYQRTVQFAETTDEDGDACEDLKLLTDWVVNTLKEVMMLNSFNIKALNFSTYGASFVHLDKAGTPVTPLYNYLKSFPEKLSKQFYEDHGNETKFSLETASPVLGNLNSGLQLYFLKYAKSGLFKKINHSLHLPQYMSYLITGKQYAELTSIGCHTALWNFSKNDYHEWVSKEAIKSKFAALTASDTATPVTFQHKVLYCGVGLHDSSAALIPYLTNFSEPFLLISTGTWCITLNPFNDSPLTADQLQQDCLCYMSYKGNPVKASRIFAGYEHEQQTKRLAAYFSLPDDHYKTVTYSKEFIKEIGSTIDTTVNTDKHLLMTKSKFSERELSEFSCYEEAYHQLIVDLVSQQTASTKLVLNDGIIKSIFVDGGFSKNSIYMQLLAAAFPSLKVYAATIAQASSIGAALSIHHYWNHTDINKEMIQLQLYP